jgi:beta-xylosidase
LAKLGARGPQLLLDANFPDPFVTRVGKTFHAYATGNQVGGAQMNVQHVTSATLTRWTEPSEAFPAANLPAWVDRSHPQVWAPEVMRIGPRYVLYYNARHATLTRAETPGGRAPEVRKRHCIGAAVADQPAGPFVGIDTPLVCADFPNGVIDPSVFAEAGQVTLTFKDDSNCCAEGSAIFVQGLSPDGLAAVGPATRLLANNDNPGVQDDWEWRVVEAPTVVKRDGAYWLFYSGNFFGNKNYSVAVLKCASPRGPCRDQGDNPIAWTHKETFLIGPGHQSVLTVGGRNLLFFHGWNADPDGREQPGVHKRCLYVSELRWPVIRGEVRPRVVGGKPSSGPGSDAP